MAGLAYFVLLFGGLIVWSMPFWHIFIKSFKDTPDDIDDRRKRPLNEVLLGCAILYFAGFCGFFALKEGGNSVGSMWGDDNQLLIFIAVSPAYSIYK